MNAVKRLQAVLALCVIAVALLSGAGASILDISSSNVHDQRGEEAWKHLTSVPGTGSPSIINARGDVEHGTGFNMALLSPKPSMRFPSPKLELMMGREYESGKWAREEFSMTESPEPKPLSPSPGDWVVSGTEVRENEVIILTGNLIVKSGGNLTLVNCTLLMNCTYDEEWQIRVDSSGILNVLEGSNITAYNPEYVFLFYVYGRLVMRDSFLSRCYELYLKTTKGVELYNTTISNNSDDGINCLFSSGISVTGCTMSDNSDNGICCLYSSGISITNCTISNNNGWGIYCCSSSGISITGCMISDNGGFGIDYHFSSGVSITNCTISNNGDDGIYCHDSSDVSITNCTISNNEGSGMGCWGRSDISITGCTMSDNGDDGIYCCDSSGVSITNCTISNNGGWGIYCYYSSDTSITGCMISDNSDGIYCYDSSGISITNCTIIDNGWGIYCYWSSNIAIHYCDICSNKHHGLYNVGTYVVNAAYCWWGSPDGPEYKREGDPYDPEEVYSCYGSEYLIYKPWLKEPVIIITIDTEPPILEITYPPEGEYVRGAITVSVDASDPSGIEKVEFYIDDNLVFTDLDHPYEYAWNTTEYSDGVYTIRAVAYDKAGNTAEQEVIVVVDNTAPIGSINHPANNTYVRGTVTINVTGEDVNLEEIGLYVDGTLLASWTTNGTYTYDWDTTKLADGSYEVKLLVKDRAGNVYSTRVIVTVDNTEPTIGEPSISPEAPTEGDTVIVKVNVTDALSGLREVILSYSTDGGITWTNITMTLGPEGYYTATIPGQPAGTTVSYKIYACDIAGNWARSPTYSYTVKAKPTPITTYAAKPAPITTYVAIGITVAVAIGVAIWFIRRRYS